LISTGTKLVQIKLVVPAGFFPESDSLLTEHALKGISCPRTKERPKIFEEEGLGLKELSAALDRRNSSPERGAEGTPCPFSTNFRYQGATGVCDNILIQR